MNNQMNMGIATTDSRELERLERDRNTTAMLLASMAATLPVTIQRQFCLESVVKEFHAARRAWFGSSLINNKKEK